ncbi:hypothetical protein NDU88_010733 [Pleurodeles waltl]|uniref:Reverse transcriptase domain-containing protein n=1 Tax=Pleurodeles waltl TaxID=8319 RepID=A0AAV7PWK9_PLEWA|nr:hypothetical protein NDU88_010733 [Pleurodeles waltl]
MLNCTPYSGWSASGINPSCFNIFTKDIHKDLKKTNLAFYADDVAIISQSFSDKEAKNPEASLSKISGWYSDWRRNLNTSKTTATLFTRKQIKKATTDPPQWRGDRVESNSSYLDVTLDSKLSWRNHIEKTCQRATTKLAALDPLLRTKSMSIWGKVRAINTIIQPTMTYASPLWSVCKQEYRKPLQILQNKALRIAPSFARTADLH